MVSSQLTCFGVQGMPVCLTFGQTHIIFQTWFAREKNTMENRNLILSTLDFPINESAKPIDKIHNIPTHY